MSITVGVCNEIFSTVFVRFFIVYRLLFAVLDANLPGNTRTHHLKVYYGNENLCAMQNE